MPGPAHVAARNVEHEPAEAIGKAPAARRGCAGPDLPFGLRAVDEIAIDRDIEFGEIQHRRDDADGCAHAAERRAEAVRFHQSPIPVEPVWLRHARDHLGLVRVRAAQSGIVHSERREDVVLERADISLRRQRIDDVRQAREQRSIVVIVGPRLALGRMRQVVANGNARGIAIVVSRRWCRERFQLRTPLRVIGIVGRECLIEIELSGLDQPHDHGGRKWLGQRRDRIGRVFGRFNSSRDIDDAEAARQHHGLLVNDRDRHSRDVERLPDEVEPPFETLDVPLHRVHCGSLGTICLSACRPQCADHPRGGGGTEKTAPVEPRRLGIFCRDRHQPHPSFGDEPLLRRALGVDASDATPVERTLAHRAGSRRRIDVAIREVAGAEPARRVAHG